MPFCDCDKCMSSRFDEKHQDVTDEQVLDAIEEAEREVEQQEAAIRTFETGATRNLDLDPDIHGFTSPLAIGLFAQYMHEKRLQADGTYRDSDNWKKGIPMDSYIRSARRHLQDLTLHHDGYGHLAREDMVSAMAGLFFNVQGYMHEYVKGEDDADLDRD